MKRKQKLYDIFFPEGKQLPFRKIRWTIMIVVQEIMMCKWRAVLKFYYKASYRKDIRVLRDILSKGKLSATKTELYLCLINSSHEITYPSWVLKLCDDLEKDSTDYKRIKVFCHEGKYIVIDGNHRLRALKLMLPLKSEVDVLLLEYR
jgi:hypothetical protein